MDLRTYSWNGYAINDWYWNGTNVGEWSSDIPVGQRFNLQSSPIFSPIAYSFPKLSTVQVDGHTITVTFLPKSIVAGHTLSYMREQLKQYFAIGVDFVPHQLIAKDIEDSNRQWYLTGIPIGDVQETNGIFQVTLALADPIWRVVTDATTGDLAINSSPNTQNISVRGNVPAKLKIKITPNNARTGSYLYSTFAQVYNDTVKAFPFEVSTIDITNGGFDSRPLVSDSTVSNQINQIGGIGTGDLTIPVDTPVGGGLNAAGGMCYVDTEQILYDNITAGVMNVNASGRGYGGTTAATHADNAVITQSKTQANGNDVRLMVDGIEVNRWFGTGTHAWNAAATQIWANIPHSVGQVGSLLTALPNNGTDVDVAYKKTAANLAVLKKYAAAVNTAFLIDSEIFTYTRANVDLVNYKVKTCKRAQKTTSFAAHAASASIKWIEHDVWLLWGQANATEPDIDDTQKPMIDLGSSTNAIPVWSNFYDTTSKRPMAWKPVVNSSAINSLIKSILSYWYTGNQTALANPSTELGLQMQTSIVSNVVKAETANMLWSFYHPAGFTNVSMAGSKYLYDAALTSWPAVAALRKSNNGVTWATVWNELKPTVAQTWQTFTHNSVALGATYLYLALQFSGSIAAKLNNQAAIQGDTVSLTLGANVLKASLLTTGSNYQLTATITNNTSGESLTLNASLRTGQYIQIDCGAKTCVRSDGANLFGAITLSSNRATPNWLDVGQDTSGKFTGAAQLVYTEVGVTNETLNYSWTEASL